MKNKNKNKEVKLLDCFTRIWVNIITDWKNFYNYNETIKDLEFENLEYLI